MTAGALVGSASTDLGRSVDFGSIGSPSAWAMEVAATGGSEVGSFMANK